MRAVKGKQATPLRGGIENKKGLVRRAYFHRARCASTGDHQAPFLGLVLFLFPRGVAEATLHFAHRTSPIINGPSKLARYLSGMGAD
jgi:hypothetical protein